MREEIDYTIETNLSVNPRNLLFKKIDGIWEVEALVKKEVNKIYYEDLYNKDGVIVSKREIDRDIDNEEEFSVLKSVNFSDSFFGSQYPSLVQIDYDFHLLPMGNYFTQTNIMAYINILNDSFDNRFKIVHHDKRYNEYSELAAFGSKTDIYVINRLERTFSEHYMNGLYEISSMGHFSVSIAHNPIIEFNKKLFSSNKDKAIKKYPKLEQQIKNLYEINLALYNLYKKIN
jgi:hypothetical protein